MISVDSARKTKQICLTQ